MKKLASQGISLPVVAAPMFLISGPELVIASCKAGIVGTFPALNQRTTEGFEEWVIQIKQELAAWEKETGKKAAPFGVNIIVHHTNPRVEADLKICVKHQVPLIITSLGAVQQVVQAVHSYGGVIFHDVVKRRHAEKAIEAGVDGLILVCNGAGGHAGVLHPVPFINEIKSIFDGTILLSGCLSTGRDVAAATQMGADFAYMGTRFINTHESKASEEYKQMIIDSSADDIVYTAAISGVPANFMRKSLESMGITKEQWERKAKVDFGKELDSEAKAWKTLWSAGQGVSAIQDTVSLEKLVSSMKKEFKEAINEQAKLLEQYRV
ncbi:nitronate monooxygenase [Constantimarinum sp. W242]|uniref:Nitronate monooxygenase n=2 Tax=Patiriisocius hiemis TaxID=3075604 RepID=A0ABU2YBT2_9FLAO|nr:nitronate monooxygenase [Constantimarinum sp. W242]MDT0555255.1 nitronate monooxygenase [Constantimarinum sp. W242]